MAYEKDKRVVYQIIKRYIEVLEENHIKVWRAYLYGSYAKNTYDNESDIDLAIFLDKDARLMKLRRNVDIRIEAHLNLTSSTDSIWSTVTVSLF